jgi:catechol 2,3-dioxygenase-like lactoylglutathione lyase family enzyme
MSVTWKTIGCAFALGVAVATPRPALAESAAYHHMHLMVPNAEEGAQWYIKNMDCEAVPNRNNAARCGTALFLFFVGKPSGPSEGTGANHIGFSFANVDAKMKALEAAGVKITSPVRDVPNLFKLAFIEDPWGTRIELVEHPEYLGFHHVHLASADPAKTLAWYQNLFGGESTKLKGRLDAVLYGKVWLMAVPAKETLAATQGRAIDHLGFSFPNLDAAAAEIKQKGVTFQTEPRALTPPSPSAAKVSFIIGPDNVRIEVVEPPK